MVDVTHVKKVSAGDKAILLGKINKKTKISAEFIAKKINTISYEVIARINPLIPRIIV
jgi:alanine racemase